MIEFDEKTPLPGTNIKIVGVGGAGGNAVNTMIKNGLSGVEFIVVNTDISDLQKSKASMKLQIGKKLTRGLGAGGDPNIGYKSAEESKEEIKTNLEGADMVFIAAGMGGGTGTGAAPMVAKIAREMGILTLGIVTSPFAFEGKKRQLNAEEGIRNLGEIVDTLILIPNAKLCEIYRDLTILNAFDKADNVLYEAAKAVSEIINVNGHMNVDFADVRAVMTNMGYALMGTGSASGDDRAVMAAKAAIDNPLLSDISLSGCESLLVNITSGKDMTMNEFDEINNVIGNATGRAPNIFIGLIVDENISDSITVTIIATGLQRSDSIAGNSIPFPSITPAVKTPEKPAPAPVVTPSSTPSANASAARNLTTNEEIEDIFGRLKLGQQDGKDKPGPEPLVESKPLNPRSELPSFLKALD